MKLITEYELGPSHWASYLINNDDSGLEPSEVAEALDWIAWIGYGMPVSCEDYGIGTFANKQTDLQRYAFVHNEHMS